MNAHQQASQRMQIGFAIQAFQERGQGGFQLRPAKIPQAGSASGVSA
jgi:hypothetical protein